MAGDLHILDPMSVLESDCPFHRGVLTHVVAIEGDKEWLEEEGYLVEEEGELVPSGVDDIHFTVWPWPREEERGSIVYRCPRGCEFWCFRLRNGDWQAFGKQAE